MNAEPSGIKRKTTQLLYPDESFLIRGACFEVYKKFRNTQKESVYQNSLSVELIQQGLHVVKEKQLPVYYLKTKVGIYKPDLIINETVIIELKAKPFLHKDDIKQFWYYLKNSKFKLGFLINFGEPNGVKIIRRVYDSAHLRSSA